MKYIISIFIVIITCNAFAGHLHQEKYYQQLKCKELSGELEYVLPDKTRVDCLTNEYAIEFDFAPKWAESIGQALYYANQTSKKPAVVLIMENGTADMKYANRLANVAGTYNLTVWLMYP